MQFIDLGKQYQEYKEEIDQAIHRVLDGGAYIMGPEVREIEETLAAYCDVDHCITTASGTDSLLIALMALGISSEDEVITVPFTWISTAEVIELTGARTRFVDIEPDTFNMDPTKLEEAITAKTKAIIPVSLFGQVANLTEIAAIAKKHGIPVIEDAAQSFGAKHQGKRSCGITEIGSTSFFPAKPFGCYGDGGALFTHDAALAEKMRAIRTHGGVKRHHHTCVGLNGRFDTIQAAVLLAKWPYYEKELEARERIGKRYNDLLKNDYTVPTVASEGNHIYAIYTLRHPEREAITVALRDKGIPAPVYYPKCLHEQPVFEKLGYQLGDFPASERAANEVFSIPMHPWLSEEEQDCVVEALQAVIPQTVCV